MILGDVISRLVTLYTAAVTSTVYDGPKHEALSHGRWVLVGSDAEGDEGAAAELTPSDTGSGDWWDEAGEVVCSAWSHYGGSDIVTRRTEALSDAEACLAAVHADRSLNGLLNTPGATTSGVTVSARQTQTGALVRVTFTVAYQALVTS
jgi:hypothetical protein